jgi:hypothetical protein
MKQISFQSVNAVQVCTAYPIPQHLLPQASARQPRKRSALKEFLGRALACVIVMAIVDVAVINFMFFPECNRITHDCFLVQHLWGAK